MATTPRIRRRDGFSLLELLTVLSTIGVLAAIAIPQYKAHQGKAFEARVREDVRSAALAEEAYWGVAGSYYEGPSCTGMPGFQPSSGTVCSIQRADDLAFEIHTSHPQSPKTCVWTSDSSPSLNCS